jgi:hypothetical protein
MDELKQERVFMSAKVVDFLFQENHRTDILIGK